jgi:osmotically-inducible protein OsmY
MKSDDEIHRDVESELHWDPRVDATDVAVVVVSGVVTLAGFVSSYHAKLEAEHAAKRVAGVVGVANDIEVVLPLADERSDPELARDAVAALKSQLPFASENIKTIVSHGWLTVEGTVDWHFERERVEKALRRIRGVKGVSNLLQVTPRLAAQEVKRKIEAALQRSASIDAKGIEVELRQDTVILHGTVRSWSERMQAERAAWSAPGAMRVENRLLVSF